MSERQLRGAELRARREELGFTVERVYRDLRIPIAYLHALEDGDFRRLPAPCYVRGFVKSYCKHLGLPADPYLLLFDEQAPAGTGLLGRRSLFRRDLPASPWVAEALAWTAICALCLFGWFAYSVLFHPKADIDQNRVKAGTFEIVVPEAPTAASEQGS